MRVSSGAITSSWHKVEIGIITYLCDVVLPSHEHAQQVCWARVQRAQCEFRTTATTHQGIHAWPHSHDIISPTGCWWILKGLEKLVGWARMHFKPIKSSSMMLRKGKVEDKFRFNITGTAIPTITEKPVKSPGKVFDCSLRDTTSIQSSSTELDGWLKSVDKSGSFFPTQHSSQDPVAPPCVCGP